MLTDGARWFGRHRVLGALVAVALLAIASVGFVSMRSTEPSAAEPTPDPPVSGAPTIRFSPTGKGDGSGGDWSRAAPLDLLGVLLANAAPGTQALLLADAGPYRLRAPVIVRSGGIPRAPVIVRGVNRYDQPLPAEIIGSRTEPYRPDGVQGNEAFRLLAGSDNLVFEDLAFRNIGNGCLRIGGDIKSLTVRRITASNIRRFIEDQASSGEATATVSGLTVSDVSATGYSRAFARLAYDTNAVLFDRVVGDSMGQDGDPFASGVDLQATVHAVRFTDVAMKNSISTRGNYWNGDGFSAEKDTYDITFERTGASGNTDAGYDLKSRAVTMIDVKASDNKRNFRFWGSATVTGCTASDPHLRGGTGTQAQVHALASAKVTMSGCTLTDGDPRTQVFDIDDAANVEVNDSSVRHFSFGVLQDVMPKATLKLTNVQLE